MYSDAVTGGTRAMVKKVVLGGTEYAESVKSQTNVARVADVVAKDESGFGGIGKGFVDPTKMKIVQTDKIERPLGFITVGAPSPKVKQVVEAFQGRHQVTNREDGRRHVAGEDAHRFAPGLRPGSAIAHSGNGSARAKDDGFEDF